MRYVIFALLLAASVCVASDFDPEWGHPLYAKNLRVGSTFRDSTTVNWAYIDSLEVNYTITGALDSLDFLSIDTLTVEDSLVVKGYCGLPAGDDIVFETYERFQCIDAGGATLGPTAPSWVDTETAGGLAFDADAEKVHLEYCVPSDWNGTSDMTFKIFWMAEAGDTFQDTETLKWDISYRSVDWGTETADNGTAVTGTVTYTQSGAGTDKATFVSEITIDYDDTDQPIAVGDCIVMSFDRDVAGDSYSGDGIVLRWLLFYNSVGLPLK